MAYEGWFTFGGTEILNAQRTMAYVKTTMPSVRVHDVCGDACSCDNLAAFLGDLEYASPLADDAPWTDPARPESYEFLGAYPLGVDNLTDATVTATVVEGADDGGWVIGRRSRPREVVFSVAMFSTSEEGDDYGMNWLKAALDGSCEGDGCLTSNQLCFLSACVDPADFCGTELKTEHTLSDWTRYQATWDNGNTLTLQQQDSWAEITLPGGGGGIEWTLTIRGEAGNYLALRHDGGEDELFLLTGSAQEIRVTTQGDRLRMGVPEVSQYAAWVEPATAAALAAATTATHARHENTAELVAGGAQSSWEQFTTIPLAVDILSVFSDSRTTRSDEECAAEYMRFLRRVTHTDGPRTRKVETIGGGVVRTVDFILTADLPWVYSSPVLAAKGSSELLAPMAVPYSTIRLTRNIPDCPPATVRRILDPLGPIIPPPPPASLTQPAPTMAPPSPNPYAVLIPASTIPQWLNSVPVVKITAGNTAVRHVRVRFFPVPLDSYLPGDIDPCSACGSFQIDYLPAGAQFTFDATEKRATINTGGIVQSAEHLVSGDKGVGAASWPELSCGVPYMVLLDARGQLLNDVEIYMVVRS